MVRSVGCRARDRVRHGPSSQKQSNIRLGTRHVTSGLPWRLLAQ
jgi:hypothetical protein